MAEEQTIGGSGTLFVGEDKTFRLEVLDVNDVPVNIAGWTILFDVRKLDTSKDPAIFSKTPSIVGIYNVVRATNTQRAETSLTDTELNLVKARAYRFSWKRMDDGSETVLAWGNFIPQKATAP
jgi:hypothetical protein